MGMEAPATLRLGWSANDKEEKEEKEEEEEEEGPGRYELKPLCGREEEDEGGEKAEPSMGNLVVEGGGG